MMETIVDMVTLKDNQAARKSIRVVNLFRSE